MPYSLVFPDPSFSMVFGLVQIKKMSNLGSKFKKRDLTLNVNRFLFQKFGIPNPKAGQIQKLVKSLVNTDICAWYCMRFFELLIIDDVQKGYFGLCLTLFVCRDLRP